MRTLHILINFTKIILFLNISSVVLLRASQVGSNAIWRLLFDGYRQDSGMVQVGVGRTGDGAGDMVLEGEMMSGGAAVQLDVPVIQNVYDGKTK